MLRAAALRIAADTGYDYRSVMAVFAGRRALVDTHTPSKAQHSGSASCISLPNGHSIEPENVVLTRHDEPQPVE